MDVIVIGGGPAGMMSAITAAKENNNVIILEKMNSCGRKLLITGKGRCNITNSANIDDFFKNIPGNPRFLYSSFNNFNNDVGFYGKWGDCLGYTCFYRIVPGGHIRWPVAKRR